MREIKFRAWDSEDKEMYTPSAITSDDDDFFHVAKLGYGYEIHGISSDPLMQYTGLKDRTGKEIFEGDILKLISTSMAGEKINDICECVYEDGSFFLSIKKGDGFLSSYNSDSEIIGNIYESPELLEKIK